MGDIIPNKCIKINKVLKRIEDEDKYMILSEIFSQKDMIIKVMKNIDNNILHKIYNKLQNHEYFNIVPIYGYMTCKDDFKNLKLTLMERGICNGTDNKEITLLIMKELTENIENINLQQKWSIFFQIILTCLQLYSEKSIIHNDIKLGNYKFVSTKQEKEMYSIRTPAINVVVNLKGVRLYLVDFDNGKIEDDHRKTYMFVEDIINTCKKYISLYDLLPEKEYNKFMKKLKSFKDDLHIHGMEKLGVIKNIYVFMMKYIYPFSPKGILHVLDV